MPENPAVRESEDKPLYVVFREECDRAKRGEDEGNPLKWLFLRGGWQRSTVYSWVEDSQLCRLPLLAVQQVADHFKLYGTVRALCRSLGGYFVAPAETDSEPVELARVVRETNDVVQQAVASLEGDGKLDRSEARALRPQIAEAVEALLGFDRLMRQIAEGKREKPSAARRPLEIRRGSGGLQ